MSADTGALVDLDPVSRAALEFDALLDWVAELTRTPFGAERIRSLAPAATVEAVDERIAFVSEIRGMVERAGAVVPGRLPDARPALELLAVAGTTLDGPGARDLAVVVRAGDELRERLGGQDPQAFPHATRLAETIPDLRDEADTVLASIDPEGGLLDQASPELRRIRVRKTQVGERLRRMLERYLRDPGSAAVLQDAFVTRRNGRFVVPLRADAPRRVRGIVHGSSSSGATHFVEPLESVELNNDLVRLAEEERDEEQRILARWSETFRARIDDVAATLEQLGRADALQARALYGEAIGGVAPRVHPGARLRLVDLRHPLLDRRLREAGERCVPATLELDPADRVLVLSGPNTGGKTVALKAVGLAVLMAQSGIPVSATAAELPLYRQVRADIGDHQSIQADLSTYSAHVRAIGESIRSARPPALLLYDEMGTGTEPTEGAALARAVLETVARPGITALATTHLAPLKTWAATAPRAASAAMDIDPDTLAPTYRILSGVVGRSAGLDIAERLGVDPAIVRRARELLDPSVREGEDYLRRLRAALREAEQRAEELRAESLAAESRRAAEAEQRRRDDESLRKTGDARLARALERFRSAARKELARLSDVETRSRAERKLGRAERRLELERRRAVEQLSGPRPDDLAQSRVQREQLRPGLRVHVASLERQGTVQRSRGDSVDVLLGGMTFQVGLEDLRHPAADDTTGAGRTERRVVVSGPVAAACPAELVLIGRRVDEGLAELERFIDSAQVAGREEVRIVHGHGTGRLRDAVRRFLDGHPAVARHRAGRPSEGGDGATVVRLA